MAFAAAAAAAAADAAPRVPPALTAAQIHQLLLQDIQADYDDVTVERAHDYLKQNPAILAEPDVMIAHLLLLESLQAKLRDKLQDPAIDGDMMDDLKFLLQVNNIGVAKAVTGVVSVAPSSQSRLELPRPPSLSAWKKRHPAPMPVPGAELPAFFSTMSALKNTRLASEELHEVILNAKIDNGLLSTADPIYPSPPVRHIYIRKDYEELAKIVPLIPAPPEATIKHVITGTTGVGKSLFGIYLLHRVLTEQPPRVSSVVYRQSVYCADCVWAFEYSAEERAWQRMTAATTVQVPDLFFFDNSAIDDLNWLLFCRNILIASPQPKNLRCAEKHTGADFILMPMWAESELIDAANKLNIKPPGARPTTSRKTAVQQRFDIVGGSAREVLSPTQSLKDLKAHIEVSAALCSPHALLNLISERCTVALLAMYALAGDTPVGAILHLRVATTGQAAYRQSGLRYRFASVLAEDMVMARLQHNALIFCRCSDELRRVVLQAVEGSLAEKVAERLLHEKLADGGLFALRDLQTQQSWKAKFPKLTIATFDVLANVVKNRCGLYYLPLRGNEVAIWPPRVVFQITISDNHDINYDAVIATMEHLGISTETDAPGQKSTAKRGLAPAPAVGAASSTKRPKKKGEDGDEDGDEHRDEDGEEDMGTAAEEPAATPKRLPDLNSLYPDNLLFIFVCFSGLRSGGIKKPQPLVKAKANVAEVLRHMKQFRLELPLTF